MKDKIIGKIDKIPEESRFNIYLKEMKELFKDFDADKFEDFLKNVFHDCAGFLTTSGLHIPTTKVMLIYKPDQYVELETKCALTSISREIAKGPSTAFVIRSGLLNTIYVNIGFLFESIGNGYPSFILNLVNAYIHEFLHIAFPDKSEQEIHDLECEIVENFLEVKLPDEFKELKSSDYYQ